MAILHDTATFGSGAAFAKYQKPQLRLDQQHLVFFTYYVDPLN
jgi:hypothetical protein